MLMKLSTFRSLSLGLVLLGGSQLPLLGQNFQFNEDDLLLAFQTTGTGSNRNVFFNLGKTTDYRDGGNLGLRGNIATVLEANFGENWFGRSDLWFGVAGNRTHLNPLFIPAPAQGEDPARVWYVSRATQTPGGSLPWGATSSTGLGSGGTFFFGVKRLFTAPTTGETLALTSDGAAVLDETQQPVGWNNSWSEWNPTPGAGFQIWTGGIQNNFGKAGSSVSVDVQRVAPSTPGSYVVSISIGSDGSITAVEPAAEPDTPFSLWMAQFDAQIPDEADRAPFADADKDGSTNIAEFALGGNPVNPADKGQSFTSTADANGDDEGDLTLTVEVLSGATFASSGPAMTAVQDGIEYRIEGSENLSSFNSAVSEVTPHMGSGTPKTGYEFKTFRLNASSGLPGKGFLRVVIDEAAGN